MSNFSDEDDSKLLAEFWDRLVQVGLLKSESDGKKQVATFLAERRERREAQFSR